MMNALCIIPARGGSKRIPGKNIRSFCGKPILAYSIECALDCSLFEEVMVSTDDETIAGIAREYGARVPFLRSPESADDFSPLSAVIEEVKEGYAHRGRRFDFICCILPTAPFVSSESIGKSFQVLVDNPEYDSIRPVLRFSYPIQRAFKMIDNRLEMFNPEFYTARSQDLELAYHDAGQFYWLKGESLLSSPRRLGFEIPQSEGQDIDTEEDWAAAEVKFRMLMGL